jgi:hypothetical protein
MSEVVQDAPQEFWRPPLAHPEAAHSTLVEVCDHCKTEFIAGARFCHVCGASRQTGSTSVAEPLWTRSLEFLNLLEFQSLKDRLGLGTASLIAFFTGLGCILAAITVGIIYSAQTLADFQAIQLWRVEWLLGALVAFVAGILLKRAGFVEKSGTDAK